MGTPQRRLRTRFWAEVGLSAFSSGLFILTLFWHDWLEALGTDPDHGDGTVEWLVVAGLFVLCAAFVRVAQLEWRRTAPAH